MNDKNAPAPRVWVLTDGKIGDDVQCIAVARALAPSFEKRVIAPRAPWAWIAPWGPIDPADAPAAPDSPIAGPPFPDVVIVSGRRAISYARRVKSANAGRTQIVILKDPRMGRFAADVIWAPAHDRVTGANVFSTLTSPHDLSAKLAEGKSDAASAIARMPKPMLGVVLGGPGGGARYEAKHAEELAAQLRFAAEDFSSMAVTPSRRTPKRFLQTLRDKLNRDDAFVWNGVGDNPYVNILAHCDALVVAADSHNMMSEAVATAVGVYAYYPRGLARKLAWFVGRLEAEGAVRRFSGKAEPFDRAPIDATPQIVAEIQDRLARARL